MEQSYVIWNAKLGGWLTRSGTYGTDYSNAATFGRSEAIKRCAKVYNSAMNEVGLIPVCADDMQWVMG